MDRKISIFISGLKMAIATFCSRVLGLVREQFIAFYFGASGLTDAFLVAYRIPNLLRDLFAEGAFSAAFVPTFVDANLKDPKEARKLLWALFCLLSFVSLIIAGVIMAFTPELIGLFAPTFKDDHQKFETTVLLARLMSPFLCFVSIAALFMGVLNSLKVFFLPSFAPAFFNVSMILSMLIFPKLLIEKGLEPILSLGLGVLIGGFLQAFIQLPLIIKKGHGPTKPGKIFSRQTRKVLTLIGPGLLGFAASQINLVINTILASSTVVGAVSWLSFSFRLFQLPVGILSVSIGNSNLVHFSEEWKTGNKKAAIDYLKSSYFLSYFLVFPAMIALYTCADEIVNVIFERGKFTAESTIMTAIALRWYALGLPTYSLYKILVPTFYAIDRQKVPVLCSVLGIVINIIFCVLLTPIYGFEVLAIGTSLSMLINTMLQMGILRAELQIPWTTFFNIKLLKVVCCGVLTTFLILYMKSLVEFRELAFFARGAYLLAYLVFIAFCYFLLCLLVGERDGIKRLISKFQNRKSF